MIKVQALAFLVVFGGFMIKKRFIEEMKEIFKKTPFGIYHTLKVLKMQRR